MLTLKIVKTQKTGARIYNRILIYISILIEQFYFTKIRQHVDKHMTAINNRVNYV